MKEQLSALIVNDDRIGNWFVFVYAKRNVVSSFQCRTSGDAIKAAGLVKVMRTAEGLPTTKATMRELVAGKGSRRMFGNATAIDLDG